MDEFLLNKTLGLKKSEMTRLCHCFPQEECRGAEKYCQTTKTCYASVLLKDGVWERRWGCLENVESDSSTFYCGTPAGSSASITCCNENLCNYNITPTFMPKLIDNTDPSPGMSGLHLQVVLAILLPALFLLLLIPIILLMCRWQHHRRMEKLKSKKAYYGEFGKEFHAELVGESTLQDLYDQSMTSGSGSGLPLLVQRTVAKQVSTIECIGKGRYGEVWLGKYQGEKVAVKIFSSRDEASWQRESEIYNTVLLRHENILGFLASDTTSRHSCTQLWLITHFMENGSLYDYLNRHVLDRDTALNLMYTAASGLVHLHTEIFGTQGKPAIAHRDIKSKNILVNGARGCVIGDFGLAVMHSQNTNSIDMGVNNKVGTKRYMAPEVLDETINIDNFESFKQADVYSFGLVLWEIASRCLSSGIVDSYQPPFWDVVPSDPSFEDMHKVVVVDQQRPVINNRWVECEILNGASKVIRDCWYQNPSARLTMLRVKKTLAKLFEHLEKPRKQFINF